MLSNQQKMNTCESSNDSLRVSDKCFFIEIQLLIYVYRLAFLSQFSASVLSSVSTKEIFIQN